ncbi:histidine kinase [uncultured Allomuricauda sp.]|uniref:histidine kinase n=1 Tax=Flagellimonas sp. W118 TaxID=3410791 RepID=UPI002608544D|nr:histidine kinase [uncultured Allomuricauda sp.]
MAKITQNSRLCPETKEINFANVLMYFSESLLGVDSEEEILWDLAKNCISRLGFVDCVVYQLDEDRGVMVQKAAYGPKNPKAFEIYEPIELPLGFGIVGHVAQSGNAELLHDTSKDERYKMDGEFRYSEVCVPIIIDGKVIGIIDCEHQEKNFFTKHHLCMLLAISSICAIKIKAVRGHKALVEKQEKLFNLREEMMELRLKAINSQLNPHFVFNALNAIQHFITSENKKAALDYLSGFSKLIRFYLKHIDRDKVKVSEEITMLKWYLKLQKLRYVEQLEYQVDLENEKEWADALVPPFIIQTLFENIIEYGAYNQYKNQKFGISFTGGDKHVVFSLVYTYETINGTTYTPEYRDYILNWQDQIELLNSVKEYNIEKKVILLTKKNRKGRKIILKLPNLNE